MKSSALFPFRVSALIGSCAAFCASVGLAQTAVTDPVGFITLSVAPGPGNGGQQLSFKGLGLTRPVEYQGSAEVVTGTTLQDDQSAWTEDQFNGPAGSYYVEIVSNPGGAAGVVGTTADIADTTSPNGAPARTLTLSQPLANAVAAGAVFKIRKHWTIATIFGASGESLAGGTEATADQVRVFNGTGYDVYFYSTGGDPGTGWRKVGAGSADQANTKILPDEGLIVARRQAAPTNVVLLGAVKTGVSSFPIFQGLNILSNPYAAPLKLKDSGLYNGDSATGLAGGGSTTADQVLIYNGSTYDSYYYSTIGLLGRGWRKAGGDNTEHQNVEIPVGASFLVIRENAPGFDWVSVAPYQNSL